MGMLGDLVVNISADISNLTEGIAQAKSNVGSLGSATQDAQGGFLSGIGGMVSGVTGFVSSVAGGVTGLVSFGQTAINVAGSLLQPAMTAETTQLSFTTLMHSASAAKKEMQDLNTFAAGTPMQTQWVDNAASKLLAFQFQSKDIIPDITAIGDSLSGLGKLSDTSLNSIVDIFGKIQASGKLTGGDMMQLSNWGIPAWQALADATGKPIPVLQKMVSKGLIPAKEALSDLTTGMEKTFGGGMAKQANTASGLLSTIASNFQIAMAAIGGPVLKQAEVGLGNLSNILASPGFQSFATGVGQQIGNTLAGVASTVSGVVGPAFQQLGPIIQSAEKYLNSNQFHIVEADFALLGHLVSEVLAPAFQKITPILPSFQQILSSVGSILTGFVIPAIDNLVVDLNTAIIFFQQGSIGAQAIEDALIGVGVAITAIKIAQFIATLPALIAQLAVWAVGQWAVASAAIATALPYIAIGALIALVVAGVILAIQHWGDISKWLQGVWSDIASFFVGLWNGILTGIGGFVTNIGDSLQGVWKKIQGFFGNLGSTATTWGKDLIQGFIDGMDSMINNLGSSVQGIANTIKSFLHFSKPDTGPLVDIDTWMPDMVNLLSSGLNAGIPKLQTAVTQFAQPLTMLSPSSTSTIASSAPTIAASQSQREVPIQIDGQTFARLVVPYIGPQMASTARLQSGYRGAL